MFFFGRKKAAQKRGEARELVETNCAATEALLVLAGDNEELVKQLTELREQLKYLVPTEDTPAYDNKIKNKIGDLRIELTKSEGAESARVQKIIKEIKLLLADRKAAI